MADTIVEQFATLPDFLKQAFEQLTARSEGLATEAFQPFPGPRVADFTPDQLASFDLIRQSLGTGAGSIDEARASLLGSQGLPTTEALQPFLDPFRQEVIQRTLDELRRQSDISGIRDAAGAVNAGAFGGARFGLVESERERNLSRTGGDLTAQLNSQNFQQAIQSLRQQQGLSLAAVPQFLGLGAAERGIFAEDARGLQNIGLQQQGLNQTNLDLARAEFNNQIQFPFEQQQFLSDILRGNPFGQQTKTVTSTEDPGFGQQLLGLGIAGVGAAGAAGGFGNLFEGVGDFFGGVTDFIGGFF